MMTIAMPFADEESCYFSRVRVLQLQPSPYRNLLLSYGPLVLEIDSGVLPPMNCLIAVKKYCEHPESNSGLSHTCWSH